MKTTIKTLLTIWITALVTFGSSAAYIISRDARINAPGELGEIFSATGFTLFIVLSAVTSLTLLIARTKTPPSRL